MTGDLFEQEDSQITVEQWLAIRKEAAAKIDAETAEVHWEFGSVTDPYGVYGDTVDQEGCVVGRNCFARSPESDVWVWFGDLPEKTRDALWERHKSLVAFSAKLFSMEVMTGKDPQSLIVARGTIRPNLVYALAGLFDEKPGKVALMGWAWGHELLKAPSKETGRGVVSHFIPVNELRPTAELQAHRAAWQSVMGRSH